MSVRFKRCLWALVYFLLLIHTATSSVRYSEEFRSTIVGTWTLYVWVALVFASCITAMTGLIIRSQELEAPGVLGLSISYLSYSATGYAIRGSELTLQSIPGILSVTLGLILLAYTIELRDRARENQKALEFLEDEGEVSNRGDFS